MERFAWSLPPKLATLRSVSVLAARSSSGSGSPSRSRGYDLWDGWIIAALVLWVIAAVLGRRTGAAYLQRHDEGAGASNGRSDRRRAPSSWPSTGPAGSRSARPGVARLASDPRRHDLETRRMSVLALVRPDSWNFPLLRPRRRGDDPGGRPPRRREPCSASRRATRGCSGSGTGRSSLSRCRVGSLHADRRRVDLLEGGLGRRSGRSHAPPGSASACIIADARRADPARLARSPAASASAGFGDGKGSGLLKVTLALSLVLLAADLVAVWAMAGKPD